MDYKPIDCSLHDRYEAAVVMKRPVRLTWTDGEVSGETTGLITDVRVQAGAEFLILSDGTAVRLDHITTFDEIRDVI